MKTKSSAHAKIYIHPACASSQALVTRIQQETGYKFHINLQGFKQPANAKRGGGEAA